MFKLISYASNKNLNEDTPAQEEKLETTIYFDINNSLKLKIIRVLNLSEISTGALKIDDMPSTRKTKIRVFGMTVDDIAEILHDEEISSKISLKNSTKYINDDFN